MGSLTHTLQQWQWIGALLARLCVGLLFFISGAGKLFVRARRGKMRETMRQAGIPVHEIIGTAISFVEFVFGGFLVVGFLTPLCCIMLIGVMLGALTTTILPGIKAKSLINWLGEFLYLPEALYTIILLWLLFSGPGVLSVDQLIFAANGR